VSRDGDRCHRRIALEELPPPTDRIVALGDVGAGEDLRFGGIGADDVG
jgi:hypothetical protein